MHKAKMRCEKYEIKDINSKNLVILTKMLLYIFSFFILNIKYEVKYKLYTNYVKRKKIKITIEIV